MVLSKREQELLFSNIQSLVKSIELSVEHIKDHSCNCNLCLDYRTANKLIQIIKTKI